VRLRDLSARGFANDLKIFQHGQRQLAIVI
jgi:hypothetical protein